MIKILKEGKIPVKRKTIYKEKCGNCGCEFEFEAEDCDFIKKENGLTFWGIHCPYCKASTSGNSLSSIEHREEVIYAEDLENKGGD